jgi:hypothetical protein
MQEGRERKKYKSGLMSPLIDVGLPLKMLPTKIKFKFSG